MNVAVLCPGPTLLDTFCGGYDLLIGVNRAVLAVPCDWWTFYDPRVWRKCHPKPEPRIFTSRDMAGALGIENCLTYEVVKRKHGDNCFWRKFSATSALVLACYLGADHIDMHGAGMVGDKDYDGTTDPSNHRTDGRWCKEAAILQSVIEHLNERGTTVKRVLPNGYI